MRDDWTQTTLGKVTTQFKGAVKVESGISYAACGVMMEGRGLLEREPFIGGVSTYKKLTPIFPGQLVLRSITAWEAPVTVVPDGYEGKHVSGVFPVLDIDVERLNPRYMQLICQWPVFWNEMRVRAIGTVLRRKTLSANQLQQIPILLPPVNEQERIVDVVSSVDTYIESLQAQVDAARTARNAVLHELLSAGGDDWKETTLDELILSGIVSLGRGNVISKKDMESDPGPYPVYSSAQNHDGRIGTYNKFMFDEELITWSVDGGGHVFYRPRHKFSVTNIGGYLRILNHSVFDYQFLTAALQQQHSQHVFDWQNKAHPSVIRKLYTSIPLPPLAEQERIVDVVTSMDDVIQTTETAISEAKRLRSGLLSDLLSGEYEIPELYDRFLGAA